METDYNRIEGTVMSSHSIAFVVEMETEIEVEQNDLEKVDYIYTENQIVHYIVLENY